MKKFYFILILIPLMLSTKINAQRFRRLINSFDIRLPQAYPATLLFPSPQNLSVFKPSDRPRFDSLLTSYQQSINDLESQPGNIQRDTMLMGYLHDQIVVRTFLRMTEPFDPNKPPAIDSTILTLAQKLRKRAVETSNPYYTWAGYIWEEATLLFMGNVLKSFEVAFDRAKLCDNCPSCKQAPECYVALAQYYAEFNDTLNTDLYFKKALNSVTKTEEKVFTLREWAVVYNKQNKPEKALRIIDTLYAIDNNPFDESWILREKARAQINLLQFNEALLTTQNAINKSITKLQTRSQLDAKTIEASVVDSYRGLLSEIYLGKNEPTKAWEYANTVSFQYNEDADRILYQIHKALGNHKKALEYYEMMVSSNEAQKNNDKQNELSILQRNYEVQKVQNVADYQNLRAENLTKTRTYLLGGLALLCGVLFLLYRNNHQKRQANILLQHQKDEIQKQRIQLQNSLQVLKSTQTQLIQKEKMASLGELTAGIAHEIQNPLNFVNNFSELSVDLAKELKEEIEQIEIPKKDKEYIGEILTDLSHNQEKINHHGKRASNIVKGMLEHSRTGTGIKEPTSINALIKETLSLSYHSMKAKDKSFNADFKMAFDEKIDKINILPQDMGRVLLNLFNNAFYAVQQRKQLDPNHDPSVSVSTNQLENGIEIRVKDNGNGIPENIRQKIFQPFFTTKPTGEGTGLGLSLSYDIVVKGHGGSLEVESVEGGGSEFIITLPFKTK